jgi:hypothetical protein
MADAEWVNQVVDELGRLENPHREKKRATILALVDARLAGKSEESVWHPRRHDTCSRTVYHMKWKHEPVFAAVLEAVAKAARQWQDGRTVRALAMASERLQLASPAAVTTAIQAMMSDDPQVRLRAAFGILDRAGVETAPKGPAASQVSVYLPENHRDHGPDDHTETAAGTAGEVS